MLKKVLKVIPLLAILAVAVPKPAAAWGCFVPPPPAPSGAVLGGPPGLGAIAGWTALGSLYVLIPTAESWIRSEAIKDAAEAVGLETWSSNAAGDFPVPVHEFGV
jgi:hypothetical protein